MEDEGFVDDDFIEETARDYVGLYGFDAIPILRNRSEIFNVAGDYLLSQTWQEILEAAGRMTGLDHQ